MQHFFSKITVFTLFPSQVLLNDNIKIVTFLPSPYWECLQLAPIQGGKRLKTLLLRGGDKTNEGTAIQ
jgi:hypothetical protein